MTILIVGDQRGEGWGQLREVFVGGERERGWWRVPCKRCIPTWFDPESREKAWIASCQKRGRGREKMAINCQSGFCWKEVGRDVEGKKWKILVSFSEHTSHFLSPSSLSKVLEWKFDLDFGNLLHDDWWLQILTLTFWWIAPSKQTNGWLESLG